MQRLSYRAESPRLTILRQPRVVETLSTAGMYCPANSCAILLRSPAMKGNTRLCIHGLGGQQGGGDLERPSCQRLELNGAEQEGRPSTNIFSKSSRGPWVIQENCCSSLAFTRCKQIAPLIGFGPTLLGSLSVKLPGSSC